jgi:CHAT domain-containing protein/tetratricopeptide (TPR) repeat protein
MRSFLLVGAALVALARPATAAQADNAARAVVLTAERAVSDDSASAVTARWLDALERDSTDRAATIGLGTLDLLTYDFPAAERRFTAMLARSGPAPDHWSVQAGLGLYRAALGQGNYPRADSILNRAIGDARRIGDRGSEMDALIGLTSTRSATGGLPAALAVLDTLETILPPGDSWERAGYLCRLGLYRAILSDSTAPTLTGRGAAMAERVRDRRLMGHCLEAHFMTHSLLGRRDSVMVIMDSAEALLRATHDHSSLGRLASRRSDELQFVGRLGEAKVALRQVLVEAEISRNRERYAFAYGGLGALALRMNDLPTAREHFERAAALYDSIGNQGGARIARNNRAMVLAAEGDLVRARTAMQAVLREALDIHELEDEMVARQQLARVAMRMGEWKVARAQIDSAVRSAVRVGRGGEARDHVAYDRGRIALGDGDLDGARRLFAGFLAQLEPDNHLHRHLTQVRLAEVAAREGDVAGAERQFTAASQELERWRDSLGDNELRRYAFAATALGEHDPQVPVARVLAALAGAGRVEAAFALAEQRRARLLTDRLNQAEALREAGVASAPAHRARPLTAAEIAGALPDSSTAILEYVAGSEGAPTTVFILTRAGVQAKVLPSVDTLAPAIRRLVALVESGGRPDALARSLGAALVEPAAAALPAEVTRLVVVPDGPLHRLPFDALRLRGDTVLVERWAIGLAPSASLAASMWRRHQPAAPLASQTRILALGDPAFALELASAETREAEVFRSAFELSGGLPRLTGSGEEARAVARYAGAGSDVRVRDDASESWLKRAPLDRYRVIHLATHALVDETALTRTALALAPGTKDEDGFLSPADIAGLKLDADMVVLSACRTAGGVTVAGEGVQGLTTPLVAAGARSVVATQWRVGDQSTVRLVGDLYDGLARGRPVAEALREAKLAALRRGAPPAEWAGFTVVGDPLTRVALVVPEDSSSEVWVRIAGWAMILFGAAYWALRRRGRSADRTTVPRDEAPTHH